MILCDILFLFIYRTKGLKTEMQSRDIMGGLTKGLLVIEAFGSDRPRQSISEISKTTGLDRATARRCLLTLTANGYTDYDGKFFTLTPRVLRLGTGCLAAMPMVQIVQPWLNRLFDEIGQSTSVSILDEDEIVYIARSAQRRVMSIVLMPGSRLPAYCTSMGRVLLAALPVEEARRRICAKRLIRRTQFTLTDSEAIMSELEKVRNQGFAVIDQEVELSLRSIAVPLFNARSQIVAAVNVGLAATHANLFEVQTTYLPCLMKFQSELKLIMV